MGANNSNVSLGSDGEKGQCRPHLPNSECEEIVYMLAKVNGIKKLQAIVGVLCPTCRQNFKDLLTTETPKMIEIQILEKNIE